MKALKSSRGTVAVTDRFIVMYHIETDDGHRTALRNVTFISTLLEQIIRMSSMERLSIQWRLKHKG